MDDKQLPSNYRPIGYMEQIICNKIIESFTNDFQNFSLVFALIVQLFPSFLRLSTIGHYA